MMDEWTIQARLAQIIDGTYIGAVTIWPHHRGGWLGLLRDGRDQDIPGSTPWDPCPTFGALVDKLAELANTYRLERIR